MALRLRQPGPNTRAIGAKVVISVNGRLTAQVLSAGGNDLSANSQTLRFGLGTATAADWVAIRWPDGHWEMHTSLAPGAHTLSPTAAPCSPAGTCKGLSPIEACREYNADHFPKSLCPQFCEHVDSCGWRSLLDLGTAQECLLACSTVPMAREGGECTLAAACSGDPLAACWE